MTTATTLGLGAGQINAGLRYIFGVSDALSVKIWLIMGISIIATLSAVSGVGRGIKRLVPTLITFFWFAIMGGTGLYQQFPTEGSAGLIAAVNEDISRPLFVVIENLDVGFLGALVSFMALILVVTYFVTSSDSGTLVVTTFISMGKAQPPVSYRVFWGIGEGAVAAIFATPAGPSV